VGARPAQVQPIDPEAVAGVTEQGPPQEELVKAWFGVERMASGETEVAFEVQRRQDLSRGDQ
jgi:hypothetical protein